MIDFKKARKTMVVSQIETFGVNVRDILDTFSLIPREAFLPEALASRAYMDEDIEIGQSQTLLAPAVHARMVQELNIKPADIALCIGAGGGYAAAVLSPLCSTVVMVEETPEMIATEEAALHTLSLTNIVSFKGALTEGCPGHAPYDVIFVNGACAAEPIKLMHQLSIGGRLIYIHRPNPRVAGQAILIEKTSVENFSKTPVFDASVPYVKGFEPQPEFIF
ncbi:MAG: protein-L-isoaspartate O-methyltransferase [Pseudobdellovibrionaceae bacterium]